jgi:hypothetical protein
MFEFVRTWPQVHVRGALIEYPLVTWTNWLLNARLNDTVCTHCKQGITNTLALPIVKMLYIYRLCPHSKHQKDPFQSKESKHFHQKTDSPNVKTSFNTLKLPKVGSNVIWGEPNKPSVTLFWMNHNWVTKVPTYAPNPLAYPLTLHV